MRDLFWLAGGGLIFISLPIAAPIGSMLGGSRFDKSWLRFLFERSFSARLIKTWRVGGWNNVAVCMGCRDTAGGF